MVSGKWGQAGLRYAGQLVNGMMGVLGAIDARLLATGVANYWHHPSTPGLLHRRVFAGATYSPWLNDTEFTSCYAQIRRNTLVGLYRCYELWNLGKQCASIEGDYLEVGVWRGGTGCLLASSVRGSAKTIYLADTFTGVVKAGENDTAYSGGEHADTSEGVVNQLVQSMGLTNVRLLKGIFPEDTASGVRGRIALLHCDVDVYTSAKETVEWAIPRLSPGGVIVFDDYGFTGCEGITRLVNEMRASSDFLFVHNLNGHAILIKRG